MRLGALALVFCLVACAPAWAVPSDDIYDDNCAQSLAPSETAAAQSLTALMARPQTFYSLAAVPALGVLPFKRGVVAPPLENVFSVSRSAGIADVEILPSFMNQCRSNPVRGIIDGVLSRCGPVSYHMHRGGLRPRLRAGGSMARLLPPRLTLVRLAWN